MDEQTKLAKAQHDLRRWLTRLKRAATMVDKLQSKCLRLERKIGASQFSGIEPAGLGSPGRSKPEEITAALVEQAPPPPCTEVIQPAMQTGLPSPDDLSIPKQFLRGKGELRRMPLSGKAALAFISHK